MLQIIFLQLVVFASPGIAAVGVEDMKNILHAMATLPTLDPTLRVDKTVQNITDSLSIHENKGEYFPTKGDDRAEELAIETKGYRFINAYLNRKLLSKGAKESFSNTESWEEDKVRKYSADDEREKYSLPNEGKGEDYPRNNSMEEDYQGNQDKNKEYSNNEGSEKDKVRNDDVREKYSHSNESKVEDRTGSRSSEEDYQGNKGEGGEYSDNGNEDWEKYFQANKDKEEDFSNNGGWKEDFQSTDDKYITLAINNEDKAKQPMKTAEELAKWAEDIQNAEGHSVERRSSEDCQDEDGPCEPHPGNGTLDSTLHSRDRSSLWPYGVKTGYPLVPYRFLITDPASVRLFEESISEWDSATCIDFVRVTAENEKILGTWEFLNIVSHPLRCLFRFGKEEGRSQTLFLHKSCQTKEEIVRGLGIALGIHYQFLRPDRDEYLHINQDNANDEFPKFQVDELADSNVPFDYSSAMQPHGVWSSRDGKVTFSTKDIKYQGLLGRSGGSISHRDKLIVNKLYGCLDRWRSSCGFRRDPCKNEGYLGQKCDCVCRRGTFGSDCGNVEVRDYYANMLPLCSKDIRAETTIETPSYEDKLIEYDTWCVWHIQAPEGQLVNLKFDSFNLEKSGRYCEDAFLEIRQKNEFFGNVYCGEDLKKEEEITSNGNELNLYLDVRNNVSKGFRAEVHFLSSPEASDPVVVPSLASRLHLCSTFFILMGINLGLLYLM